MSRVAKRLDSHGRPLNYERNHIHQQLDIEGGARRIERQRSLTVWYRLDQLVSFYNAAGKPNAPLIVTAAQAKEISVRVGHWRKPDDPLEYHGHPIVIVSAP